MKVEIFDNTPEEIRRQRIPNVNGWYITNDEIFAMICLEGNATMQVETGEEFMLNKYDYALIFDKGFKLCDKSDNFRIRIIKVSRKFLDSIIDMDMRLNLNKLFCRPRVLRLTSTELRIYELVTKDLQILLRYEDRNYSREIITGYIKVFTYTSLFAMEKREQSEVYSTKREHEISDKFITLVREHYIESRRVSFYAEKLNVSSKYLSVLVKKATGRHPTEWIDDYTIDEIKQRLATTDQPMQSISYDLGFSTPSHMTKFFHDKTGKTPKEYRRSHTVNK
ncbi:MAG: AraC family transcriptional regulator [Bacteroidales bacterium]|nr:AraC family transcriptional regulator [Candidatus Cryptobacteroides caccocaballi]